MRNEEKENDQKNIYFKRIRNLLKMRKKSLIFLCVYVFMLFLHEWETQLKNLFFTLCVFRLLLRYASTNFSGLQKCSLFIVASGNRSRNFRMLKLTPIWEENEDVCEIFLLSRFGLNIIILTMLTFPSFFMGNFQDPFFKRKDNSWMSFLLRTKQLH